MVNKGVERILSLLSHIRSKISFSRLLQAHAVEYTQIDHKTVSHSFKIPLSLCTSKSSTASGKHYLATSAALALFDELNTSSYFAHDKSFRPGVSIHLTTEVLHPIAAEETVSINFETDKIGKTLGFCTMKMINANGVVLARGNHIKFLPRGYLIDNVISPMIPFIVSTLDWLYGLFGHKSFSPEVLFVSS